ncbi:MAG: methionine--tRNA ligase, partial [Planctomycetota bacterium]
MKKTFYLTTPIYYINDVPHIGHAYCTIAADILARYKRLQGFDVFFLTGNDENSQKTVEAAKKANEEIHQYTDRMSQIWQNTWKALDITYDDFIRTTEPRHIQAVEKIFQKVYQNGDIYKSKYSGPYCWKCEAFYKESDLNDGLCPQHLSKCEILEEENYFFRLSRYQDQLLEHYRQHPQFVLPDYRKKEVLSFLESGLEDISISRMGQSWGIPLPIDKNQVIYVWFDALINYISGIGYGKKKKLKYWPANLHILGKDIIRFHCIIWPAMLLSAGLELPQSLFIHGFFTINGQKISKSLGNAIDPVPIAKKFGNDVLRYYLFADFPFGQDGDFSFSSLLKRINHELADDLGNLLSRTVSMTIKFLNGTLQTGQWNSEEDQPLKQNALELLENLDAHYCQLEYHKLLNRLWNLFRLANKYVERTAPWKLAKEKEKHPRLCQVLYNLAEILRIGGYVLLPIMPKTAEKIFQALGHRQEKNYPQALQWGRLKSGSQVQKIPPLFPKVDPSTLQEFSPPPPP